MTFQIVTAGRTHVDDFFKLSDVFTAERLNHTRPQQGIDQQIPCPPAKLLTRGRVIDAPFWADHPRLLTRRLSRCLA